MDCLWLSVVADGRDGNGLHFEKFVLNFAKFLYPSSWGGGGGQIMANHWTMCSQNWVLTGQILGLLDILSGPLLTRPVIFLTLFNFLAINFDNHGEQHLCFWKRKKQ